MRMEWMTRDISMLKLRQFKWHPYLFPGTLFVLLINATLTFAVGADWLLPGQVITLALFVALGILAYREMHRQEEQRQTILEVNEELSLKTELGDLLDYVVRVILQQVPLAEKCVIHLLDEHGRRLYPRYSSQPDWERTLGMPADKGIAGLALKELRIKVVDDVRRDPGFLPLRSSPELRSLMVAPLHNRGKLLGTISLNSNVPGAFSKRDELLVNTLAAQASAALSQARLRADAMSETHHVEAIINNLADGLVVLDDEGRVLRYNASLAHILGVDVTNIVGRKLDANSEIEGLQRLATVLGDLTHDSRRNYERQVEINEPIHAILHITVSTVLDKAGNWGQIIVLHDQTEELDLIRAKSSFLAAASRELRAPLESIRGYATLLTSYDFAERTMVTQWANQIHEQSTRLTRLAEDLADLCAVDRNELEIKPEPVALSKLVAEVITEVAPAIERKKLYVDVQCPPDLPQVPLDQERVRHVLLSLLDNAIQRAVTKGHIVLKVEMSLQELVFTLTDNGHPVPAEAQARVFRGLYRTNGSTPGDPSGTGLGLYISRKLIEVHGGHLWMPENGETGAKFQFILPLQSVPRKEPQSL
jgi:signal transduction histidine kinase